MQQGSPLTNLQADPQEDPQTQSIIPPAAPDHGQNVFQGRFGLRAVWAILLFLLMFAALSIAANVTVRLAQGKTAFPKTTHSDNAKSTSAIPAPAPQELAPGKTAKGDGIAFGSLVVVCLLLARIERRRFAVYGIGRNRLSDVLPGAFWGLALLSALVGILRGAHLLVFDGRALAGGAVWIFGTKWLLTFLTVGLMEEYFTRGFLQYTLTRGFYSLAERSYPAQARALAFWSAAVLMSLLFMASHLGNPGETAPGIIAVFFAGMVFSYALWYTGSLWWAIGFHMAWDWAQSFLYGVPDSGLLSTGRLFNTHPTGNELLSGGTTGPEGSVFVLPILLLVVVIVRYTTSPGAQPSLLPDAAPQPFTEIPAGTALEPS